MKCKQANPFAPHSLQVLHHYYELVCHRYFIQSLYDCFPLWLTVQHRLLLFSRKKRDKLPKPCIAFSDTRDRLCQLNPGCHVNSNQVSFTLLTATNVTDRFRHLLLLLRDFIVALIYSARQYSPTRFSLLVFKPIPAGRVHHRGSFRPTHHKVVCRLLPAKRDRL